MSAAWLAAGLALSGSCRVDGAEDTTGLSVDTTRRSEVLAFWNRAYLPSLGADEVMGWDGEFATCDPGGVSAEFTAKIERRINFYRALAGISASAVVNGGATVVIGADDPHKPSLATTKRAAAQRAAMMFAWADSFDPANLIHDTSPTAQFPCWSAAAWNAAKRGNLAAGLNGPEAIDGYMRENDPDSLSVWSSNLGHRRWILKQGATEFASGDTPASDSGQFRRINVLYAVPSVTEMEAFEPRFVGWPSVGHFPDELMPLLWSLSYPGADFSRAEVVMADAAGTPVPVTLVDRTTLGFGDPTIVWQVSPEVAATAVDEDTTYRVTVSGIQIGGQSVSHQYDVTVFDPDDFGQPLSLTGTTALPEPGANYFFDPPADVDGLRLAALRTKSADWVEGAEDGTSRFILDQTSPSYELRVSGSTPQGRFYRSGSKTFRLTFESLGNTTDQIFEIDREIVPGPNASLTYYFRRGFFTPASQMTAEISTNGIVWKEIDSVVGTSEQSFDDASFVRREVKIPGDSSFRLRFRLSYRPPGAINTADQDSLTGIFIDDISLSGAEWVVSSEIRPVATDLDRVRVEPAALAEPPAPGEALRLRLEAEVGERVYRSASALLLTVGSALEGFDLWRDAEFPVLGGGFDADDDGDGLANGLEYAFALDPTEFSRLPRTLEIGDGVLDLRSPLEMPRDDLSYRIQVSPDLVDWTGATTEVIDGVLTGRVDWSGPHGFARWRVERK